MVYAHLREGRCRQVYLVTMVTPAGAPLFVSFADARLVINEMRRLDDAGVVKSFAWVLMPEQLQWLVGLGPTQSLPVVVSILRGRSSRVVGSRTPRAGPLWQAGYVGHALRPDQDLVKAARALVACPLRRGLVQRIGDYPHWDAIWL